MRYVFFIYFREAVFPIVFQQILDKSKANPNSELRNGKDISYYERFVRSTGRSKRYSAGSEYSRKEPLHLLDILRGNGTKTKLPADYRRGNNLHKSSNEIDFVGNEFLAPSFERYRTFNELQKNTEILNSRDTLNRELAQDVNDAQEVNTQLSAENDRDDERSFYKTDGIEMKLAYQKHKRKHYSQIKEELLTDIMQINKAIFEIIRLPQSKAESFHNESLSYTLRNMKMNLEKEISSDRKLVRNRRMEKLQRGTFTLPLIEPKKFSPNELQSALNNVKIAPTNRKKFTFYIRTNRHVKINDDITENKDKSHVKKLRYDITNNDISLEIEEFIRDTFVPKLVSQSNDFQNIIQKLGSRSKCPGQKAPGIKGQKKNRGWNFL